MKEMVRDIRKIVLHIRLYYVALKRRFFTKEMNEKNRLFWEMDRIIEEMITVDKKGR